jgi:hypothetical protein
MAASAAESSASTGQWRRSPRTPAHLWGSTGTELSPPPTHASRTALRSRRSSCSTCVGATAARANRFAHGIHRVRSLVGAFFHTEPAGTCASQGAHMPLPLRLPSSLSRLWFFPRYTFPQSRADKSPPPSSPPPRASPPRDCPILRPRAVGCLSRGHATLLRDELRNHTPHAIPLILATRCWLLHVCIETLESPFSLQPRVVPYLHAAANTHAA